MSPNIHPVQFQVSRELHRAIRHLAIDRGTTVAQLIRDALRSHVPELAGLLRRNPEGRAIRLTRRDIARS